MKMSKSAAVLGLSLCLAMGLLSGCGGAPEAEGNADAPAQAEQSQKDQEAAEKVEAEKKAADEKAAAAKEAAEKEAAEKKIGRAHV